MVSAEAELTNDTNSKKFQFKCLKPLRNRKSQQAMSVPFVNNGPDNTIWFRFFGQEEEVSFTFAIFDDGTDVADGTHTSTVQTPIEQLQYLRDDIFTADFEDSWTFYHAQLYGGNIPVILTDVSFDPQVFSTFITGTITLKRGRVASI